MTYRILFIGDIMGRSGRNAVRDGIASLKETHGPEIIIMNGENAASGVGITPEICEELFKSGADVITLGNHAFNKKEIVPYIQHESRLIRPYNMPEGTPGKGFFHLSKGEINLTVANVCGRVFLDGYDDPFRALTEIHQNAQGHLFVDFHAEATSEKVAAGWFMDGKATAIVGTHTHIQTADERILPQGTAYITDVGMTGPQDGVIGMNREIVLRKFLTSMPARFEVAEGPGVIHGVIIEVDRESGFACQIDRIRFAT